MRTTSYHRPHTIEEACRLRGADPEACFIAGGTDLLVKRDPPATLVSLRAIPALRGIDLGPPTRIGASTLIADLRAHPDIAARYPLITASCRWFASPQIRNAATVGGNLCNASPAADLAPPLLVHEARVRLRRAGGTRELPLAQLFLGPGHTALARDEILTDVLLDPPAAGTVTTLFRKSRVRMDIALVSVAVLLVQDGDRCTKARIAAGSVAPTPVRLREVEASLEGEQLTAEVAAAAGVLAARCVQPIDDIRTTAAYRRHLVGVYVKRAIEELRK